MQLQHVFGPVPSRRLGRSLGVNPIPFKTCSYNCAYCQLGCTNHLTDRRADYLDPAELRRQIQAGARRPSSAADYVTFVGEGEPTLCASLGALMAESRQTLQRPVALITNGSLLDRPDVRREAAQADVIMPSLDAATEAVWQRVNRPHPRLRLAAVLDGAVRLRQEYSGQLWMEVMLVAGANDTEAELEAIRAALQRVAPDRVYVNVPVRPPAESWVEPPAAAGMVRARSILGDSVFIDSAEEGSFDTAGFADPLAAVAAIVRRHPMRAAQVAATLEQFDAPQVETALAQQVEAGILRRIDYRGATYYATAAAHYTAGDRGRASA